MTAMTTIIVSVGDRPATHLPRDVGGGRLIDLVDDADGTTTGPIQRPAPRRAERTTRGASDAR
jgi:hypothetical protein